MKDIDKDAIAEEIRGTCMGAGELKELAEFYGVTGNDVDLKMAAIAERRGVWRCDQCDWWVEEDELHNDICNECHVRDYG